MESEAKCERELEKWIDSLVEEMNGRYGAELAEDLQIDRKLSDINLRNELISQIKEVVRCKKISERMMEEQKQEIAYYMHITVTSGSTHFYITRNDPKCSAFRVL